MTRFVLFGQVWECGEAFPYVAPTWTSQGLGTQTHDTKPLHASNDVEKFIHDLLLTTLPALSNSECGSSSNHTETHYLTQFIGVGYSANVIG